LTVVEVIWAGPDRWVVIWSDGHVCDCTRSQVIDYLVDWNGADRATWDGLL
jgi:hypothetical protein